MLGILTELEQNKATEQGSPCCWSGQTGTMLETLCTRDAVVIFPTSVPSPLAGEGEHKRTAPKGEMGR